MSLIAAGGETESTATVDNAEFFPPLKVAEFRAAMRVDGTITDGRATHALESALYDVNQQLATWAAEKQEAGAASIDAVQPPPWLPAGAYQRLYLRAVYATAKASLIERYRDYDSSGEGDNKADKLDPVADDYRRDAAWAIADITGRRRATVELI
ncbi:head completion/stabilization protein [Marinobacter oulmenensis]|uniref:Putative 2-oxoglutarate/Fe(II)-dependent dioxygenase YbiX n=1 Tax=Marinobacter oulmenensis TaxID=643747 RepID=A0A840UI55_9GAMM|nr:head completion/stabilization protein [Marinobacter oulmenensis]MBB5320478.1 putative 2-oxoglutarate/Fe(II)-dependent dioxygenase YbiX [Marinobacter oulmenensis]